MIECTSNLENFGNFIALRNVEQSEINPRVETSKEKISTVYLIR